MRNCIISLLLCCCCVISYGQNASIDNLIQLLEQQPADTHRVSLLVQLSRLYLYEKPLAGITYGREGLELSQQLDYPKGVAASLNAMGGNYRMTGNYAKGLELHFEALRLFEKLQDEEGVAFSYHGISTVYEDQDLFKESLVYAHKVIPIAERIQNRPELMRIQSNMGRSFEKTGQLDSALHYEQNAYEIALSMNDSTVLGNILGRLGNIYYSMGNIEMATLYYKMGIPIAIARRDNNSLYELYASVTKVFQNQKRYDSSIFYGRKALWATQEYANPAALITVSKLLAYNYEQLHKIDSAYKYQVLAIATKDTLVTRDKLKQQQLLAFEEENRQRELAADKVKRAEERKHNIQYAIIAVGIISLLILFLLLSRTIIVKPRFIIFLGAVALLLFFEFINLLVHPLLESVTNHSPLFMFLALVVLAALLVPLHHRLEKWVTGKMIVKNKKVRLEAAKKTIAALEPGDTKEES